MRLYRLRAHRHGDGRDRVEAVAFRIAFGEATAHLYERGEMLVTRSEGGLANRVNPEILIGANLFVATQNGIRQ